MPGLPHLHGNVHQPGFHCRTRPGHRRTDTFGPLPDFIGTSPRFHASSYTYYNRTVVQRSSAHFFRHSLQHANTAVGSSGLISMIDDFPPPRSIPLPGFHHPGTYGSHLRPKNGVDNRSHQISSESRAYLAQQSAVRIHFQLRTICRQSGVQYSSQSCGQTTTAWRSPDKQDRRMLFAHQAGQHLRIVFLHKIR